ncbi:MAG: LCP family protein [Gordonia sp. (in: high G+C Gram-positive bacteria)]
MSRWSRGKRGDKPGEPDAAAARDGIPRGDGPSADARFADIFQGPPTGEIPLVDRLREPRSSDRFVRGRRRLTVRELLEQMDAEDNPAADLARDDHLTQALPLDPSNRRGTPTTPATPPSPPPGPRRGRTAKGGYTPASPADERPTSKFGAHLNEVTQKITPVAAEAAVDVDLSDRATQRRAIEESRAQLASPAAIADDEPAPPEAPSAPPVETTAIPPTAIPPTADDAPLQRTPDLAVLAKRRSRRIPAPARGARMTRSATVTGRVLVAVACVLSLVGTGFVWGYLNTVNGNWRNIVALDPNDRNVIDRNAQYGDENYLIVGTDTRSGQNARVGAGTTADADGARSDTVILVNVPADRSRVVAVSFPRDLQVDRPECQIWNNESGTYQGTLEAATEVKLNSVYADGGPQCLVRVVTQLSGLAVNHFIGMDFAGFEKIVNALGGVEVCSTSPIYDYELGSILRRPGKQKVSGRKALNYVRARTVSTEGNGDYGRIKRQQLFMSSLLRSTLSGNVLANPSKLNKIISTFINYSYVDRVDTQSLLKLAESMQGLDAGRVSFITLPTSGTTEDGSNNEMQDVDKINVLFGAIIDDLPLPGEEARRPRAGESSSPAPSRPRPPATPSRVSATAQNPGNVGVRVLNGTGQTGSATEVSDELSALGFGVRGVADASENRSKTVIRYGAGEMDSAATLAEMFPGASIQQDATVRSGVEVILGSDFTGTLGTVPDTGSTLSVSQLPPAANSGELPNDLAITNAGDTTCS